MAAPVGVKRVFVLTQEFYPQHGGVATYALELARAMARMGVDVEVLAPAAPALAELTLPFPIRALDVPRTQGWPARLSLARALAPMASELCRARLLVVEAASLRACTYLAATGRLPAAQLGVVLHGTELRVLTKWPHRRALLRRLLARCDVVGVVSGFVEGELRERLPGLDAPVRRTPGAVRSDLGDAARPATGEPAPPDRRRAEPKTGTDAATPARTGARVETSVGAGAAAPSGADVAAPGGPDDATQEGAGAACVLGQSAACMPATPDCSGAVRVLTVGRLHPRKGQLALVEAAAALPPALRARVRIQLVGPARRPGYVEAVRRVARAANVALDVAGALDSDALAAAFGRADVFAMPSMPTGDSVEGLGLACLEASALGLPVLAHRIGGVPEAVLHERTGLLADPADRATLTTALSRLVSDADLRQRLGAEGPAHAASFSWRTTARALVDVDQTDVPTRE